MLRLLEEQSTIIDTIFSGTGTAIAIGLNATPGVLYYEVFKKTRVYTEIPEAFLITNIICNIINLAYGYKLDDTVMIISSLCGSCLAVLWGCCYLFYLSKKQMKMFMLYCFINLNLSFELFYIFGIICKDENPAGYVALALTVINQGTPGQNIIKVFQTGNYNLIPIVTTTFGFLCGSCWFIYGLIKNRALMYIPNGLGVILSFLQVLAYIIFYLKNKGKSFAHEDENEDGSIDDPTKFLNDKLNENNDQVIHQD